MNKADFENKCLVLIILIGYIFNILFGWIGFVCTPDSSIQMLLYQIGNAFAISASVMAARYTGIRGQHVAASAYILLGITHGISLAALSKSGINAEREVTMAMPMIPALIFILWCNLYPTWLRAVGLIPSLFFILIYIHVHTGEAYNEWALNAGYATLQIIEVLGGFIFIKTGDNFRNMYNAKDPYGMTVCNRAFVDHHFFSTPDINRELKKMMIDTSTLLNCHPVGIF